jgi:hypothetical protein
MVMTTAKRTVIRIAEESALRWKNFMGLGNVVFDSLPAGVIAHHKLRGCIEIIGNQGRLAFRGCCRACRSDAICPHNREAQPVIHEQED